MDSQLTFNDRANKVISKVRNMVGFTISNSKNFNETDTVQRVYYALVCSYLEFVSVVRYPTIVQMIDTTGNTETRFLKH